MFAVLVIILLLTGVGVSLCTFKTPPTGQTLVAASPSITIIAEPSPSISTPTMASYSSPMSLRPRTGTIISGEHLQEAVGELILHNNDSSLDELPAIFTGTGTLGADQTVLSCPFMVLVYLLATGYVPAGTETGSMPTNVSVDCFSKLFASAVAMADAGRSMVVVLPFKVEIIVPPSILELLVSN